MSKRGHYHPAARRDRRRFDIGDDGQPVGYDVQHASTKAQFIAGLPLQDQAAE